MKPAPFEYFAPTNLAEAVAILSEHADDAKILAGGQSLVPVLNSRLGRYNSLIDINGLSELTYIRADDRWLQIGALTRQRAIEASELVARHAPLLSEATKYIAHLPIRTRGTIGGSISHADPAAEDPAAMLALDAEFDLVSTVGRRTFKARDFFLGPLQTALAPHELLTGIRVPLHSSEKSFAFEEVSRRRGDFAIIGIAAELSWEADRVADARIAVCGLESGAIRLDAAEQEINRARPSEKTIATAARAAAKSVEPQEDLHASSDYRRHLVEILTQKVLERATRRLRA
jgi:CO/xanthine dehydrogenase FAD-binding subunit